MRCIVATRALKRVTAPVDDFQDHGSRFGMRAFAPLTLVVAVLAASVLVASETQRTTAETNFAEAQTASSALAAMLGQARALDDYLLSRRTDVLADYYDDGRSLDAALLRARGYSSDDAEELHALDLQTSALTSWRGLASAEIAAVANGGAATSSALRRRGLVDRFEVANAAYARRLATNRSAEGRAAALVPFWLILGLSLVAGLVALVVGRRVGVVRRSRERAEGAKRARELRFAREQARFAEAMQVTQTQGEAHELLVRHLTRTIAGSDVVVLNRNNSADRLEASPSLPDEHPLAEPLVSAVPRSCLAVRLSRRYERGIDPAGEVLSCDVCGALPSASSCQPLLVAGEVIGSVLVAHRDAMSELARRRVDESVTQAAPVLANLRNLAIAETRAATDVLTGLPNRRNVDDTLKRLVAHAERTASPLGVILLDLDHFKQINDTYGHERGDEVLAAVGALLRAELRGHDFAGRSGGEEFVAFLPETDRADAIRVAEKVRLALHRLTIRGLDHAVTASFGVSAMPDDAGDGATLLRLADRALYAAKQAGRDRVETTSRGTREHELRDAA
jgi:diguanylate cyclase (GGDEF)-like protein